MALIIISVDFAFFQRHFWERLAVNITIVIVCAVLYFLFARRT